jgi:hypothetical protein
MSSNFLDELREKIKANNLDPEQPLRIQMGRDVVFRGVIGQEPEVNKLSDSRVQLLQAVMNVDDHSSTSIDVISNAMYAAIQNQQTIAEVYDDLDSELVDAFEGVWGKDSFEYPNHSHQTVEQFFRELGKQVEQSAPQPVKGTVNIDLGDSRIFRYAKGEVEVNSVGQPEQAREDMSLEEYRARLRQIAQAILKANPELAKEIVTIQERHRSGAVGQGDLSSEVYIAALSSLDADQSGVGQDFYEQFLPEMTATRNEMWATEGVVDFSSTLLDEVSQVMELDKGEPGEESLASDQSAATDEVSQIKLVDWDEPQADDPEMDGDRMALDPVTDQEVEAIFAKLREAWDEAYQAEDAIVVTLPATAIARIEMHDLIPEAQQAWVDEELDLTHSALVEELQTTGKEATRERFSRIQMLPRALVDRALADSITVAARFLEASGKVTAFRHLYDTESYVIRTDPGKQNYSVTLRAKEVFAFQRTPTGVKIQSNTLPKMNQWDILAAGQHALKLDMQRSLKGTTQQLTQMAQGLGHLAPKGSRDAKKEAGVRQTVGVIKQILGSPLAKLQGKQKAYSGEHYQATGDPQQLSLSAQDGRGEILRVSQTPAGRTTIQSRISLKDIKQIGHFGQALQAFQQTVQAKAAKVKQATSER